MGQSPAITWDKSNREPNCHNQCHYGSAAATGPARTRSESDRLRTGSDRHGVNVAGHSLGSGSESLGQAAVTVAERRLPQRPPGRPGGSESSSDDCQPVTVTSFKLVTATVIWNPIHLDRIGQNSTYQYVLVCTSMYKYVPVHKI